MTSKVVFYKFILIWDPISF